MPSAADPSVVGELAAAQAAAGRPLRFDEFMRVALYGDHGFYTSGGQAGRRGDFLTAPEVGPLFGAVLARWIDAEHGRLGRPADFTVVEVGAGPGTLARAVLLAAPQWAGRYVAVEVSAAQRAKHPDGVTSLAEMPEDPFTGVVIANELLDNLPFRLAVYDGGWREAMVEVGADGRLERDPRPGSAAVGVPATFRSPRGSRVRCRRPPASGWVTLAEAFLPGPCWRSTTSRHLPRPSPSNRGGPGCAPSAAMIEGPTT